MELYFVRHGETDHNKFGISQGQLPGISLNQTGINQSLKTAEYLKEYRIIDKNFDVIYCSPLDRAKETCNIISKIINNKNIIYDDRLMELGMGDFSGIKKDIRYKTLNIFKEQHKKKYKNDPIEIKKNINELDLTYFEKFKMETNKNAANRGISFMNDLVKSNYKKILIVSHGKIMENIFKSIFNTTQKFKDEMIECTNCFICYMIYKDNKYKMIMPPSNIHLKI